MSHAACLVAIDPTELELAGGDVEQAVEWQMEPFSEQGEWFKDGSRWDWYVIGGRFTGQLSGYDPATDPRNFETCKWCAGTGVRKDMVIANACNGCSGTGTARKFLNAEHSGDVQKRSAIDLTRLYEAAVASARGRYAKAMKDTDTQHREWIYGIKEGESEADYLARKYPKPETVIAHLAFLRNQHWHEGERSGWFGTSTASECERHANPDDVEAMIRRCKYKDAKTGACCVVWNEPYEIWSQLFWKRFVEPLSPDTLLVTVDYHV